MRLPISVMVERFVSSQDVSPISAKKYRSVLGYFLKWVVFSKKDIYQLTRSDIIRYKSDLIKKELSAYTVSLYLSVVRSWFDFLTAQGIYTTNIADGIRSPRKGSEFKKEYLTAEQVRDLLNSIPRNTITDLRDYAIVSLLVRTGVRRIEVCRMLIGDIISEDKISIRLQRKGRVDKSFRIGITEKTILAINDYIIARGNISENDPLFISHKKGYPSDSISSVMISRIVKKYLEKIGLTGRYYTCHSLRHTAAVLALKSGASIYDVQQMLGHTSIETTRIYLRALDAEKNLNNEAIRRLDELF